MNYYLFFYCVSWVAFLGFPFLLLCGLILACVLDRKLSIDISATVLFTMGLSLAYIIFYHVK